MVNSIRDRLDEADTISEITLSLGHNKDTVCIVVEGEDDQTLFRPLFTDNVVIFQSYNSKNGVDNIVKTYFPRNKRVIGIRDKDYLMAPIAKRSFHCDYCCAEMMIISINECFERIYCGFYKNGGMDSETLRIYCLERLEKLSKYRQLNEQNDWHVKFDGIKPSRFYNTDITIMEGDILSEINSQNPDNIIDGIREAQCCALRKCTSLSDYLNITNGHDFVNLFYKVCTGNHGQAGIQSVNISMRASFGKEEFKKTQLYTNLLTYQTSKNISIVE